MQKYLLASIALAAFITGPALAADLRRAPIYKAPPPVAVFTWTGCYVGGHIGGGWANKELNGPFAETVNTTSFGGSEIITAALSDSSINLRSGAFLGGGQIGCNYQLTPNWVIGIEGDASWTNLTTDNEQTAASSGGFVFGGLLFPSFANSAATLSWKTNFIGTLTGRLGYATDRIMIYAKGGAAWTRDRYAFSGQVSAAQCNSVDPPTGVCTGFFPPFTTAFNFSASESRLGWTVGAGIEWALWGNWSAKVEYDYLDFGRRNVSFVESLSGATAVIEIRQHISEVKFGLNYRFGGPI